MSDKLPKLSVGMPVYNGAEYLPETLESILKQTFSDFELVISDNASTDNTQEICQRYVAKDSRLRYFRNERNIGASDNYNAVYYHSRGEYFKWASSNDLCDKNFLQSCVDVLDSRPDAVLAHPKTRLFETTMADANDYNDNLDIQDDNACTRFKAFITQVSLNNIMNGVIRSAALRHSAMIKPFFSSDVSLMAEMSLYGKFVEIPQYYFYRRMDPKTATKLKNATEVLRHYDPDLKNLMLFPTWKINLEYWKGVFRAPISMAEKICLYRYLFRHFIWARYKLWEDVRIAMKKWKQA